MTKATHLPGGSTSRKLRMVFSNPADLAFRDTTVSELSSNELWRHGPPWLKRPPNERPSRNTDFNTEEEEEKPLQVLTALTQHNDILGKFSNLPRALRVICYIFRFYNRTRAKQKTHGIYSDELSAQEIVFAKNRLIIACQKFDFLAKYIQLAEQKQLSRKSSLLIFNLFLDANGAMRVNGRSANSDEKYPNYDERYHILLPYHARFTRLGFKYLYPFSTHGQNAFLYRLMRLRYYVPKLNCLIKAVLSQRVTCVRHKRQLSQQIMVALHPNQWRLGRIDKIFHGLDSRVHVAEIRTANGITSRTIVKLILLPMPSSARQLIPPR